jgi:hypothetical protein
MKSDRYVLPLDLVAVAAVSTVVPSLVISREGNDVGMAM